MINDPCSLSLIDVADAIRDGGLSSIEVTEACLARIAQLQGSLNCFIRIDQNEAREAAARADAHRAADRPMGSLHGVPLAHKDCFYQSGKIATCGTRIRKDFIADRTATVLERLEAQGAINLGSLNMAEWAFGATGHNEHFGDCRNPWSPNHVPGGSSSGSASAVAAQLIYGALGTDLGGSIRLPAAFCGIVGMKPTLTRVSRFGVMPMSYSMDHIGPLARTVLDCARLLTVIAGHAPEDPSSSQAWVPDYEAAAGENVEGKVVAVPYRLLQDLMPEIVRLLEGGLQVLSSLGVRLVNVELHDIDVLDRLGNLVQMSEAAALHARMMRDFPQGYSDQVRQRIEPGFFIPARRYVEALHLRSYFLRKFVIEIFEHADLLYMPVQSGSVPTLAETDVKGTSGMPEMLQSIVRWTRFVSFLGLPSLCIPVGFTAGRLPFGVQFVGRPFAEALIFQMGHAFEAALSVNTSVRWPAQV